MKTLEFNQMEKVNAGSSELHDALAGFTCGLSLGLAIGSGGWMVVLAVASCASAFDW